MQVQLYHARNPPHLTTTAPVNFNGNMDAIMRKLICGVLPMELYRELTLPLKTETPSFGAGLPSTHDIRCAAFMSSVALTADLVNDLTSGRVGDPLLVELSSTLRRQEGFRRNLRAKRNQERLHHPDPQMHSLPSSLRRLKDTSIPQGPRRTGSSVNCRPVHAHTLPLATF